MEKSRGEMDFNQRLIRYPLKLNRIYPSLPLESTSCFFFMVSRVLSNADTLTTIASNLFVRPSQGTEVEESDSSGNHDRSCITTKIQASMPLARKAIMTWGLPMNEKEKAKHICTHTPTSDIWIRLKIARVTAICTRHKFQSEWMRRLRYWR